YIAAGIVAMELGQDVFKQTNVLGEALEGAIRAFKSGAAVAGNKVWIGLYDGVVSAVASHPLYKDKAGLYFVPSEKKRSKSPEKVEWTSTLAKIQKMKQANTGKPNP